MALQQGIAEQLAAAYGSGDTAAVNNLLQANQVSAGDVQSYFNLDPAAIASSGLNFYSAPAAPAVQNVMGPLPTTPPPVAPPLPVAPTTGIAALQNWYNQTQETNPNVIAYQMQQAGVTPEQVAANWNLDLNTVKQNFAAALPYTDVYRTFLGGDVAATNAALAKSGLTADQLASGFLLDPAEMQALRSQGYNVGFAKPEITSAFAPGEDKVLGLDDLNRGFEWAQANKVDEAGLKRALGEDTYKNYTKQYGEGILSALQPVFADGKLSAQEALDVGLAARKFGIDVDDVTKYTNLKPEVAKALFDGFDKTVSGIVGNALDPTADLTTAQRIGRIVSLQNQGFTDADIAKYSNGKVTEKDVKEFLDPVKNFAGDFQKLFSTPDVTAKDVSAFLDKARTNAGVASLYGDKLDTVQNKLAEITPKWARYGVDPLQAETLYSQINKITEAAGGKNWQGSWMSGGNNAALEAAAMLQKRGVDSLSDLKTQPKFEKNAAVEMYQGQTVQTDDQGRKYIGGGVDEFGNVGTKNYLPAGTQTQLFSVNEYQDAGEGGGRYVDYRPLSADELKTYDPKTGKYDMAAGSQLIDASTGKVVATGGADNRFTLDQYETGNFFKGKDKSFGIQFTKDGVPIPFTTTEKTGLVYTPILPILLSVLGVPGMIGQGLASLAPSALASGSLANMAVANALMSGGVAALTDQNVGKAMLGGAVTPLVGNLVGGMLPTDLPPSISKAITSTAGNIASAAARGAPVEDVLKSGILSGVLNYGLDQSGLTQSLNLSPQELKLLSGVVLPALTTGKVNPYSMISTLMPTGKP